MIQHGFSSWVPPICQRQIASGNALTAMRAPFNIHRIGEAKRRSQGYDALFCRPVSGAVLCYGWSDSTMSSATWSRLTMIWRCCAAHISARSCFEISTTVSSMSKATATCCIHPEIEFRAS